MRVWQRRPPSCLPFAQTNKKHATLFPVLVFSRAHLHSHRCYVRCWPSLAICIAETRSLRPSAAITRGGALQNNRRAQLVDAQVFSLPAASTALCSRHAVGAPAAHHSAPGPIVACLQADIWSRSSPTTRDFSTCQFSRLKRQEPERLGPGLGEPSCAGPPTQNTIRHGPVSGPGWDPLSPHALLRLDTRPCPLRRPARNDLSFFAGATVHSVSWDHHREAV